MRKLLGLLVAAVFVVSAGTSAFAQTWEQGTPGKFKAEVSFVGDQVKFGFTLKKMGAAASVMPADSDAAAEKIDWLQTSSTDFLPGVTPGAEGYVNSKVYAEVVNQIEMPGYKVLFYTNNTVTENNNYVFPSSGDLKRIGAMIEKRGDAGTGSADSLPISYRMIDPAMTDEDGNPSYPSSYTDVDLSHEAEYGTFFVTDLKKEAQPAVPGEGIEATDAYDPVYATIATLEGNKYGLAENGDTHWRLAPKAYMLFGTSFYSAKRGYSYGTDTLTVEVVTE